MLRVRLLAVLVLSGFLSVISQAQAPGTGLYAFGSFDNRGFDSINVGNLNIHFTIPIVSKPGRGMNFNYALAYDNLLWNAVSSGGQYVWSPEANWGFSGQLNGALTGYMTFNQTLTSCPPSGGSHIVTTVSYNTNYIFHDSLGATHPLNYSYGTTTCGAPYTSQGNGSTSDGSGMFFDGTKVHTRDGQLIDVFSSITDSNGNTITVNPDGTLTDTLGVTALAITGGTASSPRTFTYHVARQADSSTTAAVTMTYHTYTVQTNFGCSGVGEFGPASIDLVDRVTLADGTFYQFNYENTPGIAGAVTGRLASVTLPTGGTISYQYSGGCNGSGMNPDGSLATLTRTADGVRTYSHTISSTTASSTTVQDELGNQSNYFFTTSSGLAYETHRQIYQGNAGGTPLQEQFRCYNSAQPPCDGRGFALPITQMTTLTNYNGGVQDSKNISYDASGMPTLTQFSSGGSVLKTIQTSYNSLEEPTGVTVTDGPSTPVMFTSYGYDETTPTATSGIPQHNAASGPRGNLTSVHVSAGATYLNTTTTYYDTGVPIAIATPNGTTNFSYDPTQTWATTTTLPTPSSGISLSTSANYDPQSGAQLSATGMNGEQTQVTQYERLLRPVTISLPNGGQINYSRPSANELWVSQSLGNGQNAVTDTLVDGYGRTSRLNTYNGQADPNSDWYQTDSCYDASGLLQFQSVKYAGPGNVAPKQCSGNGTSYTYDALGRVTSVTNSDGTATIQYFNRAVKTTDVNGVQKIIQYDLLGRISGVCEVSSNNNNMPGTDPPTSCNMDIAGTGFVTSYSYSLSQPGPTRVTTIQQGAQVRSFQIDPAGRLVQTVEPERGTTNYGYAYNGTGLVVTRTRSKANQSDPNVKTNTVTQYDNVGRVVSIAYDDGTPGKGFWYDQATAWGNTTYSLGSSKGRLTAAIAGTSSSWISGAFFAYDNMGHVVTTDQCVPSGCQNSGGDKYLYYSYNLAGDLTSSSDGIGATTSYTYSPAHEITSITSSLADATDPPSLVSNIQNGPYGPLTWSLGNGLSGYQSYDSLGRPFQARVCAGTLDINCPSQPYGLNVHRTGSEVTYIDDIVSSGTGGSSGNYSIDEFGRLSSSAITNWNGAPQQSFSYVYDRYGNRWQQNAPQGGPAPSYAINSSNNQITSFSYDAAGNLMNDGFHSYSYDAEGNVIEIDGGSGKNYYNAFNQRVRQERAGMDTLEYVYNLAGQQVSIWNGTTQNWIIGQYYWGSKPVAFYGAGTVHFQHQDWLGTERVRTSYNGAVEGTFGSLPFGDGFSLVGADAVPYHFTGLEHDLTSNTEHAQFRQYSSTQGRWMSPDPYLGSYDFYNPQSFNRYAYVRNNPLNLTDPTGLNSGGSGDSPTACEDASDRGNPDCINNGGPINPGDPYTINVPVYCFSCLPGNPILTVINSGPIFPGKPDGGGSGGGGSSAAPNNGTIAPLTFKQKATSCAAQSFGISTAAAGGAVVGGLPLVSTAGKFAGSTPGTSIISSTLSELLPGAAGIGAKWAPTLMNPLATSAVAGRVLGRWIPIIGEVVLAKQGADFGNCLLKGTWWDTDD